MAKALLPKRDMRYRDAGEMLQALRTIAPLLRGAEAADPA
jgi:hypothetical protein